MFLALLDPDPLLFVRIRILPSTSKQITCCLVTSDFLQYLWRWMRKYVPTESNKQKNYKKTLFCWHLGSHWRKEQSSLRNQGSGSVPRCHWSGTLLNSEPKCRGSNSRVKGAALGCCFPLRPEECGVKNTMSAYFTVYMQCILQIGPLCFIIDIVYYR